MENSEPVVIQPSVNKAEIKDTPVTCNPQSYQVYKKTAEMWVQSWNWDHNYPDSYPGRTYSFSAENLETLKGLSNEENGLRIYYILENASDTIPSLAIVNIATCSNLDLIEENEACVLIADEDGGHFSTPVEVCPQTSRWRAYADSKKPIYTPVYAYNYNWSLVENLQGIVSNPQDELKVTLGLRTVGPTDTSFQINSLTHKGSIGYVNILHATTLLANAEHNFDFTMPCPQYCDSQSALSNPCN